MKVNEHFGDKLSRWLAWIAGGVILFGSAVPVAIDVVARATLGRTVLESFEMSEYALAACIGLGMGYTVTTRANVRVDILTARLPRAVRLYVDLFASVTLAATAVACAVYSYSVLEETWRLGARSISTLQVPLILPQSVWWIGFVWFATIACLTPLLAVHRLLKRDLTGVETLISNPQLSEEIEEIGIDTGDDNATKP
jgi:TRAP-type C4-dicarboxylate transport system permease small subunit